jgi:diadenosine tetraphosphate (Ap4A) HIT family hydrolase
MAGMPRLPPLPSARSLGALPLRVRRAVGRTGLRIAQTAAGGRLVGLVCAHASALLPVERVAETDAALVFRHPVPEAPEHLVIVPKTALRDLCALVAGDRVEAFGALVAAARLAPGRERGERVLTINVGARQQVAQLHAHLLPLRSARLLLAQVRDRAAVDLGSPDAVRAALAGAVARLGDCDPSLHGSLVVRGLDARAPAEVMVCIAPRDATR